MQQGYTLVELILYMALLSLFLSSLVLFAWNGIYIGEKAYTQEYSNSTLRFAIRRIEYEIRRATSVNSLSSTSISLASSDANRDPTIISYSSQQLWIGWGSTGACPTSSPCQLTDPDMTISAFSFTDLSGGSNSNIQISITGVTSGNKKEYQSTKSYRTSIQRRNS